MFTKELFPSMQTRCSVNHWKMSRFCDKRMAISDLQGAVWNQIKHVIGDLNIAVVFNRALCQLLRQSFNQVHKITETHNDYLSTLCCKETR